MPVTVSCPKCHFQGSARDSLSRKTIKCPKCGERFQVGPVDVPPPGSVSPEPKPIALAPVTMEALPIRFTCPNCKAKLTVPEGKAGSKAPCPKCGQRLQVPQPALPAPQERTLVGELIAPANVTFDVPPTGGLIQFKCPFCSATSKAPANQRGMNSRCPECREPIKVPFADGDVAGDPFEEIGTENQPPAAPVPACISAPPPVRVNQAGVAQEAASQPEISCPYCGEFILAVARKCKHCGEMLDSDLRASRQEQPTNQIVVQQVVQQQTAIVDYGSRKSVALAIILAFLFGPLGMLYSTIIGALVMFLINLFVGFFTGGADFLADLAPWRRLGGRFGGWVQPQTRPEEGLLQSKHGLWRRNLASCNLYLGWRRDNSVRRFPQKCGRCSRGCGRIGRV